METSQRKRTGKIVESSVRDHEGGADEHAQHSPLGEVNEDERALNVRNAHALENAPPSEDSETTSSTLGRLVESTTNDDSAAHSPHVATKVIEIDADDWIDKDLEALSSPDQAKAGDATTSRTAPPATRRRFPYLDLRIDERLGRILLSIVLSALLWFYVLNLENPSNAVPFTGFTIDVRNSAPQLKVTNLPLPEVNVTVQGPKNVLDTVVKSDIRPYIDLKGISEGVREAQVLVDMDASKRRDLTISVSRSSVQVQLELEVTQVFTVSAQTNGTPAVGYRLDPAQVTPDQVRVTGLKEAISRVAKVIVPVDIEGRASTQQGSKSPIAVSANGQVVDGLLFDPQLVQVLVPIKLLSNYRIVTVKPSVLGQPAPGYLYSITADPSNITICCSPNLEQIGPQLGTDPIPITGTSSTVITSTKLLLPQGVELYFDQPRHITVTVNVQPIVTSIKLSVAPAVEGLASGYSASVAPNQIDLTLSGTFSQLQGLSPADIRAVVSADGRGAGTYTVKPQINVPQGVKIVSSSPDQVTLTLLALTPLPTRTLPPQPTATRTLEAGTSVTPVVTRAATPVATTPTPGPASTTPTQPSPVTTVTASPIVSQTTHPPETQVVPTATVGQP